MAKEQTNRKEISPCPKCGAPRYVVEEFGGIRLVFTCDHGDEVMHPLYYHLKREVEKKALEGAKPWRWKSV